MAKKQHKRYSREQELGFSRASNLLPLRFVFDLKCQRLAGGWAKRGVFRNFTRACALKKDLKLLLLSRMSCLCLPCSFGGYVRAPFLALRLCGCPWWLELTCVWRRGSPLLALSCVDRRPLPPRRSWSLVSRLGVHVPNLADDACPHTPL